MALLVLASVSQSIQEGGEECVAAGNLIRRRCRLFSAPGVNIIVVAGFKREGAAVAICSNKVSIARLSEWYKDVLCKNKGTDAKMLLLLRFSRWRLLGEIFSRFEETTRT